MTGTSPARLDVTPGRLATIHRDMTMKAASIFVSGQLGAPNDMQMETYMSFGFFWVAFVQWSSSVIIIPISHRVLQDFHSISRSLI